MSLALTKPIIARTIAALLALATVAAFLLGPALVYRLVEKIPLDATGPTWEIWLLIAGGAVGSGGARYVHYYILTKWFHFGEEIEEKAWHGQK